jgi:hypothetical protein
VIKYRVLAKRRSVDDEAVPISHSFRRANVPQPRRFAAVRRGGRINSLTDWPRRTLTQKKMTFNYPFTDYGAELMRACEARARFPADWIAEKGVAMSDRQRLGTCTEKRQTDAG